MGHLLIHSAIHSFICTQIYIQNQRLANEYI